MPVTLRFQSTGAIPGDGHPVEMRGNSLTVGRAPENDLVLPDPDKTLSKRHCVIEDHNGNVVVVDISSNGTFLNYGKIALGATPTPLNHGDILTIGPYEILVHIPTVTPEAIIPDPLMEGPVSHGIAAAAPSAAELLDAPGDGGDFLDDLLSGREGPVGHRGVEREEPDEDGLLPPLGSDDPLLPPAPEDTYAGAAQSYHNASPTDHFAAPGAASGGAAIIPDDWEDDLLAPPTPPAAPSVDAPPAAPFDPPPGRPGSASDPFGEDGDSQPPIPATPRPGIPDDFDLGDGPLAPPEPATPPAAEAPPRAADLSGAGSDTIVPEARPDEAPPRSAPAAVVAPAAAPADTDAAAQAFLKALGADDVRVDPPDLVPTMSRLGHVLRIFVAGLREVLMTRTSIKSEFRIQQTVITAGGNNPLKFSISPDQAIEAMVKPKAKGYLDAADAAEEALKDIKAHEVAMVSGMEAALKGVLRRLDPAELEGKIEAGGGLGGMLKSKKARYWEVYEKMYAEISDQAENEFHELFAKEFARAYQEQLEKLK
ncbi:MAG: type VI secretion system-associated FHA domain protein TagH [Pseudomonadota bacterium]